MKRSIGISMAVVLLALTVSVDSAKAQYYRPHHGGNYQGGYNNGGSNIGSALVGGIIGGIIGGAIVSAIMSNNDRRAMRNANSRVYDEDCDDGCRSNFEGDGHSGYLEMVSRGRHANYDQCRQIRTVVYDRNGGYVPAYRQRPYSYACLNIRNNSWDPIDEMDFRPMPSRHQGYARRPYGSYYVSQQPQPRPYYAPYQGVGYRPMPARPYYASGPQYPPPIARPYPGPQYAPPVAGPVGGGWNRPSGPPPRVLPAVPQTVR